MPNTQQMARHIGTDFHHIAMFGNDAEYREAYELLRNAYNAITEIANAINARREMGDG